jgi:hypothetical protein
VDRKVVGRGLRMGQESIGASFSSEPESGGQA